MLDRKTFTWHGKQYWLLGKRDGESYFLEQAKFDCGWYWAIGYIETFTNKSNPAHSKDISSHQHFDSLFLKDPHTNGYDAFNEFFNEGHIFSDKQLWKFMEIMASLYTVKDFMEFSYRGGSHYTSNPCMELLKDKDSYDKCDEKIKALLKELRQLLAINCGVYEEAH